MRVRWSQAVADHLLEALRKKGAGRCSVCGSESVQLVSGFQEAHVGIGMVVLILHWHQPSQVLEGWGKDDYVEVTCDNCGLMMRHQLMRITTRESLEAVARSAASPKPPR